MKPEYKLDRMRQLMALLGNPKESLRIVHVAGTSGKTSRRALPVPNNVPMRLMR